ncbi:MAG: hypothetical protein ACOH1R_07605 [Luteimonas sp.]
MPVSQWIADHYLNDARHFLLRYSLLRLEDFNKAGRVKNFMDVVMAAECALKAHIFQAAANADPLEVYRQIRRMSHDVSRLADAATFLPDRCAYEAVKTRLGGLSIGLRYSLDMWETYFPSFGGDDMTRQYDRTLATTEWRTQAIAEVQFLIDVLARPPEVAVEFNDLIEGIMEMQAFADAIGLRRDGGN